MLWELEWGSQRKRLEEIEEESGETPPALERQPELKLASTGMLLQCFMTLHMMRSSNGFGPNPITLGMIREYIDMFGELPVDRDLLVRLMKECDEVALEWLRKRSESSK